MMARFIRACDDTTPHTGHEYVKHWRLIDLPLLPRPELYPPEWDAVYACKGRKLPGKTWAESLGIVVPENAPGGQRISLSSGRVPGSPQNLVNLDYDGFYDVDAWRK